MLFAIYLLFATVAAVLLIISLFDAESQNFVTMATRVGKE